MKNNTVSTLALTAALAGLMGGTAARVNAQTVSGNNGSAHAGVLLVRADQKDLPKHSCKGKNDCKGQGGGKNAGKNSCKGKGDCATDGSKMPKI